MSDHDPFDGIYSSTSVHAESDKGDAPTPEQEVVEADAEPGSVDTVYSSPYLRRQSKADLQKIAREKRLDLSGGRDDLIERIEDDQRS